MLQNKIEYKEAIKEICAPFFVIERTSNGILSQQVKRDMQNSPLHSLINSLFRFCSTNIQLLKYFGGRCGWVLKVPYTTNSRGVFPTFHRICRKSEFAGNSSFFLAFPVSSWSPKCRIEWYNYYFIYFTYKLLFFFVFVLIVFGNENCAYRKRNTDINATIFCT
jgi:hypothetical protein